MLTAFVVVVLGASTAPISVGAPGLSGVNVDAQVVTFYNEHVSQHLADAGLRVATQKEIGTLIGIERQKQLLGCADDATTCSIEMANALGTDALLVGDIARFGADTFQLNLKIISSRDG